MQTRVTERSIALTALMGLQGNLARLGDIQQQLSSGKMISRPSDSPSGTVSAMHLRGEVHGLNQYSRNASDGLSWLGMTETAIRGAVGLTARARDLVLQGMSSGTGAAPDARAAIAAEIESVRDSLINAANTRYVDRPVFGGTTAGNVAYAADGTYLGDAGVVARTVADSTRLRIDVSGPEVFGTGSDQIFTVLTDVADHLRTDPAALSDDLDRIDTAMATMKTQLSDVGARYNRVDQMRQTAEDRLLTIRTQLSDVEDIDLPNTIMELQLQQVAYQAALAATARAVGPSLVDFLR